MVETSKHEAGTATASLASLLPSWSSYNNHKWSTDTLLSSKCFRPLHTLLEYTLGHKPPVVLSKNKHFQPALSCGKDNATFEFFGNESSVGKVSFTPDSHKILLGGHVDGLADGVRVIVRDTAVDGDLLAGQKKAVDKFKAAIDITSVVGPAERLVPEPTIE